MMISEKASYGEVYNVCSGKSYSIKEILEFFLGLSSKDISIAQKKERVRSIDIPVQVGSYEKLHQQTGWEPSIPLEKTLRDLYDYWLNKDS